MFAKCPTVTCAAVYRVESENLRSSMGMIRCVKCRCLFNAVTFQEERPPGVVIPLGYQLPFVQVIGDRIVIPSDVLAGLRNNRALKSGKSEADLGLGSDVLDDAQIDAQLLTTGQFSRDALRAAAEQAERTEKSSLVDGQIDAAPPTIRQNVPRGWLPSIDEVVLAARSVLRHRRRSAMGLLSIGLGVTAMLLAGGFIEWSKWFLRENTIFAHLGHIQLVKKDYFKYGESDPFAYMLNDLAPLARQIEQMPEAVAVAPRLSLSGLVSFGDVSVSFLGEGVDPVRERKVSASLRIIKGTGLAKRDQQGVIIGKGLAANLNVVPGQKVVLLANPEGGGTSGIEVEVLGVFQTSSMAYDDVFLRMPLALAQQLLHVTGAHRWVVLLKDTAQTQDVLTRLRNQYGNKVELEFVPWSDLADFYNKTAKLFSAQINVVWLVIALIIVVSISNTFLMNVIERTGEIGTLLALGQRQQKILRLFISEGVLLGCIGGAGGALIGWLLAELISAIGIPMPPAPGMDFPVQGKIMVTWSIAAVGLLLGVAATIAASVYPARKAARLNIVDALRHAR